MTSSEPVRLIATDLDGTVVPYGGAMSGRTVEALRAVEAAGIHLVLVTGRPPRWMAPIVEATGHRGRAICANGAFIHDLHTDRVVESFLLDPEPAVEVAHRLRALMPEVAFAAERADGFAREAAYEGRWPMPEGHPVLGLEALLGSPVAKLLARDDSRLSDDMLAVVGEAVDDLATVTHANAADSLLEISGKGVSKASTLARLCTELGVRPEEVVAFGDQPNDLPMLSFAGRGYAVADAHPAVLRAVPEHVAPATEDGVAIMIERILADL